MRVLLIGSYRLFVKALKQGLEEEGFTVEVAGTDPEADEPNPGAGHDAIVLDLGHPQETGLSWMERWRGAGLKTPILVLAAPGGNGDRPRRPDGGANIWLTKPFRLEELLSRLRAVGVRRRANGLLPGMHRPFFPSGRLSNG